MNFYSFFYSFIVQGSSRSQGTPALVVVPPTTAYLSLYTFVVPTGIDTATLILTVPNGAQNGIYINSAPINTQWTAFPNAGNVYGARYPLTPGVYTVQHTSNALFGAYVYGKDSADSCSVAFSAGMNVGTATNCGVSTLCFALFLLVHTQIAYILRPLEFLDWKINFIYSNLQKKLPCDQHSPIIV
jgi:hypothetical protein